jgi:predicted RNase H-like HicB family nuclease
VDSVILTARVSLEDGRYVAKVDQLPLEGTGDSVEQAQDELIQTLRGWIEFNDTTDSLEREMEAIGFPGVAPETEVQLEFLE